MQVRRSESHWRLILGSLSCAASDPHVPDMRALRGESLMLELAAVILLFALFLLFWWIGARQFARLRVAPEGR